MRTDKNRREAPGTSLLIKTKLLTANIQEVFPWFSKYHNAPKTNDHNEYAYINTTKLVWCELLVTKVISICIPVVELNPKYVENRPTYYFYV